MATVSVAAPTDVAALLSDESRPWLRVLEWAGRGEVPPDVAEVDLWVPPYPSGLGADEAEAALARLRRLRAVQLLSAGVEPWPALVPEGVQLCAGRGIHGGSTAELAVALTLAAVRDLPRYLAQQQDRQWRHHEPSTLAGRSVVVLGAGDIGGRVAEVLRALDARVHQVGRRARDGVDGLDALPGLLARAAVVVVAVPLTAETRGLLDATALARLPDGALVVNVARGPVVDTAALAEEVLGGRLRAALDVTDPEPLPAEHALWGSPDVILTPHVGGGAQGWEERAVDLVADQVRRLRDGEPLRHVVTDGY